MTFLDLTGELLKKIDFEKSEIIQLRKLVFVCGGKASNNAASPASLRELLLHRAADNGAAGRFGDADVLLAEEAMNALATSNFSNLLDLEEYIAAVVHAVILIVESPGSMCELGAFVKTSEIRDKLIVVLPSEHKNVPSFITKGAIDFLTDNCDSAQILAFYWKTENGVVSASDFALSGMLEALPSAMQQIHSAHAEEKFQSNKRGHLIYLTLAFCHYLRCAKLIDLRRCFNEANINIDEITLKRSIDTLIICKLMKSVEHGKLTYYVPLVERAPFKIAFKSGTQARDRNSMRWITRIKDAIASEENFRIEMFREHQNV